MEDRSDFDDEEDVKLDEIGHLPGEDFSTLQRLGKGLEGALPRTQLEVLQRPARTAAIEQLVEARRAYEVGDRHAAILHFRKALEHRPLAYPAGYSLARLLATSTQREHCREASRLARRMARLAESERHPVGQGLALAVAARAELSQGNEDRAVELAREAIDSAETLASVRVEVAIVYATVGLFDRALEQAQRAFLLRPESFMSLERAPVMRRNPDFRSLK